MKGWICLWLMLAGMAFAQVPSTNHLKTLQQSRWFAVSGGFANALLPESYALAALCAQTNAGATFERLLQEKDEAQKLYGLLGLQLIAAPEFKTALPPFLRSEAEVQTLIGCIAGKRPVSEMALQIQNGRWTIRTVPVPGGKYAPAVVEKTAALH
jgi:hypothetical protein